MGSRKAAVLPLPVTALPHTSLPARTTGITAVCQTIHTDERGHSSVDLSHRTKQQLL